MEFPRLAVVSDCPPERGIAGGLLLYRLLSAWPKDRLLVTEGNLFSLSNASERLPEVTYQRVRYAVPRFHRTRFVKYMNLFVYGWIKFMSRRIVRSLRNFAPEAILTQSHGHLWVAAADAARRLDIPLHMLCQDDLQMNVPVPSWAARITEHFFKSAYRQATTRFCICPYMAEYYETMAAARNILYSALGKTRSNSRSLEHGATPSRHSTLIPD